MIQRTEILGVEVSAVSLAMAVDTIDSWVSRGQANYVCVAAVDSIMESYRRKALQQIHNSAGLVLPAGMPLVWLSRLQGFRQVTRVYGPDLMLAVCERSLKHGYRHYFYGGAPEVAERVADKLLVRFPGLNIAGILSPPCRELEPEEQRIVVGQINLTRPDVVWVGTRTPKQEMWMAQHRHQLQAPVLIGVGSAFDFHAGIKRQSSPWMMRAGLKWLFHVVKEPEHLAPLYLVNNLVFFALVIRDSLSKRLRY